MIGRTIILTVSIITRKGLRGAGAPIGRSPAITELGLKKIADTIKDSQRGKPREREIARCLVGLKTYGIKPLKFIKIKNKKRPAMMLIKPPIFTPKERKIWDEAVSLNKLTILTHRGDIIQYVELKVMIVSNESNHIKTYKDIKTWLLSSKEEKISTSILIYQFHLFSFVSTESRFSPWK